MTPFEPTPSDAALRQTYRTMAASQAGAHLSEDEWVALASDDLDAATRARFADHIERCASCAEVFRAVATLGAEAGAFDAGAPQTAASGGWWSSRVWVGLAAAATVVLAVAPWLTAPNEQRSGPEARRPGTEAAAPAPALAPAASSAPVPAAEAAPAPALRAWAELPAAPSVTLPASLALEVRGTPSDRDAFLAAFGPAIAPYREGRYAAAALALAPVAERFSAIPETWFYLGVSRLYAGQPADAVDALARAAASDAVGAQAAWLRVVALERARRGGEASAALADFCRSGAASTQRAACASPATP